MCIRVVAPRTGRLAPLGAPLGHVPRALAPHLTHVRNGGRRYEVTVAVRDSRSEPGSARRAARELADEDGARIVLTMAGTRVLPAVTEACEEAAVPCVSTTFGLDDIAGLRRAVGGGLRGRCRRLPVERRPAGPAAAARAVRVPAGARPGAATRRSTTRQAGLRPRLITCSRWLTYPHTHSSPAPDVHAELGDARVATLVYWSPGHPYRSSLDGTTCAELARAFQEATGASWLQPLGLAHALPATAHHALATADDPADRASVADAVARTRLDTVAGTLDWTGGPTPDIALLPLVGGQWQSGPDGPRLAVAHTAGHPEVPLTGDLTPAH
ncbi:ABC transporter substrate-binding protein [Streptomyces cinerochromogenes]|uniref:ABC transporter substrate-binding protein n=1 Tax=Streptomyces cinerochromogenes TaxID=66422 RepID=A0ABW7B8H6_9ACTN